ncbi:hypothetical protein [Kitasatospora sp. NPDC094015]|uniref:hypothetical protein n=1 Tax=Kitasatospora sp. NPDC094015 TaxID=3155205 RepID=UPI003323B5CD
MSPAGRHRPPLDRRAAARSPHRRSHLAGYHRGRFPAEEAYIRELCADLPPEARYVMFNSHLGTATGGDLLWWWAEPDGRAFGCLVQVRRLARHRGNWRIGSDPRACLDSQLTRLLYAAEHFRVPAAVLLYTGTGGAEGAGLLPAVAVRDDLRRHTAALWGGGVRFGGLDGPALLRGAVPVTDLLTPVPQPRPPAVTDAELAARGVAHGLRPLLTEPQSGAGAVARTVHDVMAHHRSFSARTAGGEPLTVADGGHRYGRTPYLRHVADGLRAGLPAEVLRTLAGHGPARLARYVAGVVVLPVGTARC